MHLRFSDEELATLVEMVSLAADVANMNQTDQDQAGYARFEAVESKILETAKHNGMASVIEFDPARNKNRVTEDFQKDSYFQQCLEEFRNSSFWEELMVRLAERDTIKEIGEPAYLALDDKARQAKTAPLEQRYWAKFISKGITPLHWIEPNGEG
ncbi:MAG: hypothetical protein ACSHYF_06630 [Verrucomicrobiaceae bacterium]